jgi:carboxylesterase
MLADFNFKKNNFPRIKGAEPLFIDKKSKVGVLMLHGFTGTPYQFKELAKYLAGKGLTVYAPLVAGHGTSPEDLINTTMEDWKKSVKKAYAELEKKVQKIIVVGNSFGGNLGFYLAKEAYNSLVGIVSLGTPINLRFQWFIKLRLFLYGWLKKYYRKPQRIYKIDYTDMIDEVTYPVIPIKSLREFLKFLKTETVPNLNRVKVPALIMHANVDPVVNPKSALHIYEHLASSYKKIYWFDSGHHVITNDKRRDELFQKIYNFIQEIS